jgi:hypothetical protein
VKSRWAAQYACPAVVVQEGDDADAVVAFARELGAVSFLEGDESLVVELRDVGPELYSEDALRRSLR